MVCTYGVLWAGDNGVDCLWIIITPDWCSRVFEMEREEEMMLNNKGHWLFRILILLACNIQYLYGQNLPSLIDIHFVRDGKEIDANDFEIFIIQQKLNSKIVVKPLITDEGYCFTNDSGLEEGYLYIKYKNLIFTFGEHKINFSQNTKLVLGVDRKRFLKKSENVVHLSEASKAIVYLEKHPLEFGCGVRSSFEIKHYRKLSIIGNLLKLESKQWLVLIARFL